METSDSTRPSRWCSRRAGSRTTARARILCSANTPRTPPGSPPRTPREPPGTGTSSRSGSAPRAWTWPTCRSTPPALSTRMIRRRRPRRSRRRFFAAPGDCSSPATGAGSRTSSGPGITSAGGCSPRPRLRRPREVSRLARTRRWISPSCSTTRARGRRTSTCRCTPRRAFYASSTPSRTWRRGSTTSCAPRTWHGRAARTPSPLSERRSKRTTPSPNPADPIRRRTRRSSTTHPSWYRRVSSTPDASPPWCITPWEASGWITSGASCARGATGQSSRGCTRPGS
mmetsp:Transcript_6060/g.25055  ORF Transcript_6060/g.25055 Transcript_6060/m.25055 type:complete len:285 (+) Transcript_6060:2449-3303(+)